MSAGGAPAVAAPPSPGTARRRVDLRPVGYVVGLLIMALGVTMIAPLLVDVIEGRGHWPAFFEAGMLTVTTGAFLALACANGVTARISIQQGFLLTTSVWAFLPIFAAIPFMLGATEARPVDAVFEAMSGLTTTGATVFVGLDTLPKGLLLWRSMLNWFGGIGIIIVAMVFLPELRVGGMQIFRNEAFDTMGKILPRAAEIASRIAWIYLALTACCYLGFVALGMPSFDALNYAFSVMSTGGFGTRDASFAPFQGPPEYLATVFMILASLPFVRYVQFVSGVQQPLWRDTQVRAFLATVAVITLMLTFYQMLGENFRGEASFREALFNTTSIITGTGLASVDYQLWGPFAVVVFFFAGFIGGCAGSTVCSVKIFRYQILFASIGAQIRRIHSPSGLFQPRFDGRPVPPDVLSSVMAFFVMFLAFFGIIAVLLGATGLDFVTSVSGAATAIGNVGPGLGEHIGPAGNFAGLNDAAKWLLIIAMLLGRLEVMVVLVLFIPAFWRG